MIQPERIRVLNDKREQGGNYVLYWMQASQRAECNHALEYAVRQANERGQPVVALFGLTSRYPDANLRHYAFMLEGLREVQQALRGRAIQLVVRQQSPQEAAVALARDASMVIADRGYFRTQKAWRDHVARKAPCPVFQVETDVVVPVEVASQKEEYAAATLRPKIHKHLERFLVPLKETRAKQSSLGLKLDSLDLSNTAHVLARLRIDRSVSPASGFKGDAAEAKRLLDDFIAQKLDRYAKLRNDPSLDYASHMSPYLHFGQISPLYVALEVLKAPRKNKASKQAYLEELIVRRELSMNFVHCNADYDSYEGLPNWAKKTLQSHKHDRRETAYTVEQLERARTHDPYWNAAQQEMVITGKMHNYMRMYWGKKILEWSKSPEDAFHITAYLNNKYELDGRDPNSFASVAWCFGKHDRPWGERPIFGNVRYMNATGLRRKFNIGAYVQDVGHRQRKRS